jgi:hypothetical protein
MELHNSEAILLHPRDFGPGCSHDAAGQERGNKSSRGCAGLEGDGWGGSAYCHKAAIQTNLNASPQHIARPLATGGHTTLPPCGVATDFV